MVGLFVFFYANPHFTAYAWFDMGLVLVEVLSDLNKRPFILVGMLSWILLLLLALTSSFSRAIRWLCARRWHLAAPWHLRSMCVDRSALLLDASRQE